MNSFNDQFKKNWGCCLANFEHIAVDPIKLKDCYARACSVCYKNLKGKKSFCSHCQNEHEIIYHDKMYFEITFNIKNIKSNNEVIEFTKEKMNELCKSIEKERLNTDCKTLLQSIRDKIEKRTDFLIHEVMHNKKNLEKTFNQSKEKIQK